MTDATAPAPTADDILLETARVRLPAVDLAGLKRLIPSLAKDPVAMQGVEQAARSVPTTHDLILGDARKLEAIADGSVHLVLTSPPY